MQHTAAFEEQRPRLLRLATRILGDAHEAEDVVQNAWLRMDSAGGGSGSESDIDNLPAWLTTVTTRLCLDRLRARIPTPEAEVDVVESSPDAADDLALAETVGVALHILLDRLTPTERVSFVLHDSFGFDFETIAQIVGRTPVAVRKLASRARSKVAQPTSGATSAEPQADWQVFAVAYATGEDELKRSMAGLTLSGITAGLGMGLEHTVPGGRRAGHETTPSQHAPAVRAAGLAHDIERASQTLDEVVQEKAERRENGNDDEPDPT